MLLICFGTLFKEYIMQLAKKSNWLLDLVLEICLDSKFPPVKLRLKTDLVSYPARAEGLVNSIK